MIIRNNDLPREDIEGYAGGQGVLEFTTLVPTELLKMKPNSSRSSASSQALVSANMLMWTILKSTIFSAATASLSTTAKKLL